MSLFKQVKLLTPESIELKFTLAGIGSRALALLIDYHVLALSLGLFGWLLSVFLDGLMNYLDALEVNYGQVPLWVLSIGLLLSFAIYTGYFVLFEVLWQGQSPGKRLTKIRVIRDNGQPVRLAQATLRALLRPVDDFLFIGMFFIMLGQQEKRLGDWVAGTLVIQEDRPHNRNKLMISDSARQLAIQLPDLINLEQLQPDDFAVISDYLNRRPTLSAQARNNLSLKLAREIREIVQLAEIPQGLTPDQFLEAIYLAYQQQFPAYE